MTFTTSDQSIQRLITKCSSYIGHHCSKYIRLLFDHDELSAIELEILVRIFTMGFYSDEVLENACFTALDAQVFNVVDFNFLVCEVNNSIEESI